ncbi:type I-E CRISPR-associated protein Cas7/Cse4/CasC [Pontiellaceae bacterium B12219]|nr:type I-E CRISPR-associated protein Cas7/Cse4/CasC [Pontiellaceae bacterium B12219]
MNVLELHILQSFPVTCLNRDDVGAPKSAIFGGQQRARVSSQCWKRAIREQAAEFESGLFTGKRGHFIAEALTTALCELEVEPEKAKEVGEEIATFVGKKNAKSKAVHKTDVALFFSKGEIAAIASMAKEQLDENGSVDFKKGGLKKCIEAADVKDLGDISIFGRMVASDHTLMLEGAGMFSHALSTHKVSNEIDFFSAVDDMSHEDDEGAGHIGTLEFNSACYYRYIALNLDLLRDEDHLSHFTEEEFKAVVDTFIRASILAVPNARKNSMMGFNPPEYVLGTIRQGQPVSLVNAFEEAVRAKGAGVVKPSIEKMIEKFEWMKKNYGFVPSTECRLPEMPLDAFVKELVDHA